MSSIGIKGETDPSKRLKQETHQATECFDAFHKRQIQLAKRDEKSLKCNGFEQSMSRLVFNSFCFVV